ncbi:hypothetical protein [Kiloniella sp.]|uniref:hypothetical protein n=1 Tax=Kiloniella sp. TaxID=1938587 RepID=UPI003A92DBFD
MTNTINFKKDTVKEMSVMALLWTAWQKWDNKAVTYGEKDIPNSWFQEGKGIERSIIESTPETAEDMLIKVKLLREFVHFECSEPACNLVDSLIDYLENQ